MTDEELNREVKEIVTKHLKQMVADVEWKLMISIDKYDETICNAFADKLFQCFQPLISMKFEKEE